MKVSKAGAQPPWAVPLAWPAQRIPVCSAVGGRRRRQCKSLQRGLCVSLRHAHHTSAQFLFLLLDGNNGDGACALLPAALRGQWRWTCQLGRQPAAHQLKQQA